MKKNLITISACIFIFFFSVASLNAVIHVNDIVPPFPDTDQGIIESNVIEGATFYFKSQASVMELFAVGESGSRGLFDFSSALSHTYTAIEHLQKARSGYIKAYSIGKVAGYVKNSQNILIGFDYDAFAAEHELNKFIFDQVKFYLGKGDVTGFYMHVVRNVDEISEILTTIKSDLEKGTKPETQVFWKLLQRFSETTLFGNYGTMVGISAFKK